jgi:hypothetical protein
MNKHHTGSGYLLGKAKQNRAKQNSIDKGTTF